MERTEESMGTRDLASTRERPAPPEDANAREAAGGQHETGAARRPDAAMAGEPPSAPLVSQEESGDFRRRWEEIQTRFVDEPQRAVEEADALIAACMQQLADGFARERERLEGQWSRGEDVSTEDLRVALQRYRSFFQRLLSA
jgi:hypothetical protein